MEIPHTSGPLLAALLVACAPPPGGPPSGQPAPSATQASLSSSPASPASPASAQASATPSAPPPAASAQAAAPRADCAGAEATELLFPPTDAVVLSNATTEATGDRGYPDLLSAIRARSNGLRCCHDASRKEAGEGTLAVEIALAADGKVKSVTHAPTKSDIKDQAMGACVAAILREITFPTSRRGRESTLVLPLVFRSKGSR